MVDVDDAPEPRLVGVVSILAKLVMTEKLRLVAVVLRPEVEQAPLSASVALHLEHFLQ